MQGCIVVLCGLPASGKTTLVSKLRPYLSEDASYYHVEYDALMPSDVESSLISESLKSGESSWKTYREGIVACVDQLLEQLAANKWRHRTEEQNKDGESQGACLERMRDKSKLAYANLKDTRNRDETKAEKMQSETDEKCYEHNLTDIDFDNLWARFKEIVVTEQTPREGNVIVLVDDNMYYRSMRYQYYQLARKYAIGFCQVFVECPVDVAIARNNQRLTGRVDEKVIRAMANKMEAPDISKYYWECNKLVLRQEELNLCCPKIRELVSRSVSEPVQTREDDTAEREESRRVSAANLIHQSDQILRKLLAAHMKTGKESGMSKTEMKSLSTRLMAAKSGILENMRTGDVSFNMDNAPKEENNELFKFVRELFQNEISHYS